MYNNKKKNTKCPSLSLSGLVGFDNKWWLHNHSLAAATTLPLLLFVCCSTFILCIWERRGWHGMAWGGVGWGGVGYPPNDKSRDCVSQRNLIFGQIFGLKVAGRQTSQILLHTLCLSLSLSLAFIQSASHFFLYTKPINPSCCHVSSRVLITLSYIQNQLTHLVVMFHPECLLPFPIYKTN